MKTLKTKALILGIAAVGLSLGVAACNHSGDDSTPTTVTRATSTTASSGGVATTTPAPPVG